MAYLKRVICFLIILLYAPLLVGCVLVDGSSVKSQLEVSYNNMFATEFDYLKSVAIYKDSTLLHIESAEDFLVYLEDSTPIDQTGNYESDYLIKLVSEENDLVDGQKEATLFLDIDHAVICSDKKCVSVKDKLIDQIEG
ncbi:hypothetical protein [Bacillus suaedae]|uniref:Lipoprotein n=1 Tax=Halalkalibacter suaedae TaxID=2822140 RepID=A0A940WUW4_9BACI|nr:hypothetical protein [Bacillus suaedae]MBP3950917.1 hypothetical protein [Bacillus suaedae]